MPEVASVLDNASAQTSARQSVWMLSLSTFVHDPVRMKQCYDRLNFPLICLTSFLACRLLGVSRLPAFCVGLLFTFTRFRIAEMLYSYLPNYFMVPLALVPVIWILSGRFSAFVEGLDISEDRWRNVARLLRSRDFLLGFLFVVLTAVSDGYYGFFTLLLLGFSAFARMLLGDWRRPLSLLPVGTYIIAVMVAAILLQLPLQNYKKTHRSEFYPNGIAEPALVRHPFEAEIYSTSLKLLIAPNEHNRIKPLGALGKWMVQTSEDAHQWKRGNYWPLGMLVSILFGLALTLIAFPSIRRKWRDRQSPDSAIPLQTIPPQATGDALFSLPLFSFL